MKKAKFETDCEIPFKLDYLCKRGTIKYCGIILQDGRKIGYINIPSEVRFGNAPFIRYLKTEEGQDEIKRKMEV